MKPTTLQEYEKLAADVRASLEKAHAASALKEVASLSGVLARCLDRIGRLSGQDEVSEAMILKSPAFQRIRGKLALLASKYPMAAKEFAELLESSKDDNNEARQRQAKTPRQRKNGPPNT